LIDSADPCYWLGLAYIKVQKNGSSFFRSGQYKVYFILSEKSRTRPFETLTVFQKPAVMTNLPLFCAPPQQNFKRLFRGEDINVWQQVIRKSCILSYAAVFTLHPAFWADTIPTSKQCWLLLQPQTRESLQQTAQLNSLES